MRIPIRALQVLVAVLASPALLSMAASIEPVPLELLLERTTIHSVRLAPRGDWVAIVVTKTNRGDDDPAAPAKAGTTSLQLIPTDGGEPRTVTPSGAETNTVAWSPDGTLLAFDVQTPRGRQLALWNIHDGSVRAFADLQLARGDLLWSADGRTLFASVKPPLADENASAPIVTHRPDRDALVPGATVTVYRAPLARASTDMQSYESDNFFRGDLARIDVATGKVTRLTANLRPQSVRLAADGRQIAFANLRGQKDGNGYRHVFDLMFVDTDGDTPARTVARGIESISTLMSFSWSPDARYLAYTSSSFNKNGSRRDGYIVDIPTQQQRLIQLPSESAPQGLGPAASRTPLWSAHSDALFLLGSEGLWRVNVDTATAALISSIPNTTMRSTVSPRDTDTIRKQPRGDTLLVLTRNKATKSEGIYEIDLSTGKPRKLLEAPVSLSSSALKLDVSRNDGTLVYAQESADRSEQLWISDTKLRRPRQLSHLNPDLDSYTFGRSQLISWQNAEHKTLYGALLLPANHLPGRRCPLVVENYRGDALSDGLNLFGGSSGFGTLLQNTQTLATRGFCVLSTDSPARSNAAMGDIAADVLPGIDQAIKLGIADPERIGVKGHSRGGYDALSLIVGTNRFKAAVVSGGFANLFGMHGQMLPDGTHWGMSYVERSDNLGATPWEQRQRYIDNSPYFFLDRVQTPVLLIHGAEDTAVSPRLADEVFVSLRRLGKEVEYAKYAGEGHIILKRSNALDAAQRMIEWFDRHLNATSLSEARPDVKRP